MKEKTYIQCKRCWKTIEQKWPRVYCIPCRKAVDKENAKIYRDAHADKIRELCKKRYHEKKGTV